ncbi:MAG: proton-conducting transporter membrane subunit, partial [Natronospirillum sp.]
DPGVLGGALYYLIHSTFVVAGLYLLAEVISIQRGTTRDYLTPAQPLLQSNTLGTLYFLGAASIVGLPPLSGFISKLLIFQGSISHPMAPLLWALLLLTGLVSLISLARAGSTLFWRTNTQPPVKHKADSAKLLVAAAVLLISPAISIFAQPVVQYAQATAQQIATPTLYIDAVLSGSPAAVQAAGDH